MQQSGKKSKEEDIQLPINVESWAMAPEFVPRDNSISKSSTDASVDLEFIEPDDSKKRLCPHEQRNGLCRYPSGECSHLHGDMSDLCSRHPHNAEQRRDHTQTCKRQQEADMEIAFAASRSNDMLCGICFEIVTLKPAGEKRFGILPNCNHCFCLTCIRRWRSSRQFENKIIRACPECRVTSDFVCPSMFWVETSEEKQRAIGNYLRVLSIKDCKYFRGGRGCCPFGNKCFYRHCTRNGTQVDVGPPPSLRSARHATDSQRNAQQPPVADGIALTQETNNLLQEYLVLDLLPDVLEPWNIDDVYMDIDYLLEMILDGDQDLHALELLGLI